MYDILSSAIYRYLTLVTIVICYGYYYDFTQHSFFNFINVLHLPTEYSMMFKKRNVKWTDEIFTALLQPKHTAIIKKQDCDKRPLMNIIYEDWKGKFLHITKSLRALKIYLSRL